MWNILYECLGHAHAHGIGGGVGHLSHIHRSTPDLENIGVTSGSLLQCGSGGDVIHGGFGNEGPSSATEMLTPEQIDAILMRHDQVLSRAWCIGGVLFNTKPMQYL